MDNVDVEAWYKEKTYHIQEPKYESKMILGNITIYQTRKFNFFHRFMYKICFDIKIINN